MGPTIASWGVLCRICVDYFAEQPNKRTYRRLVLALLVWAPLDTTMCISQGIYLAAFLNASVVLLFWYLCHRLWRSHMILSGKNHQNQPLTIRWDLVALENHGPLIPTIPALVLAKKIAQGQLSQRGAMHAINLMRLEDFTSAVEAFNIKQSVFFNEINTPLNTPQEV